MARVLTRASTALASILAWRGLGGLHTSPLRPIRIFDDHIQMTATLCEY